MNCVCKNYARMRQEGGCATNEIIPLGSERRHTHTHPSPGFFRAGNLFYNPPPRRTFLVSLFPSHHCNFISRNRNQFPELKRKHRPLLPQQSRFPLPLSSLNKKVTLPVLHNFPLNHENAFLITNARNTKHGLADEASGAAIIE